MRENTLLQRFSSESIESGIIDVYEPLVHGHQAEIELVFTLEHDFLVRYLK